MIIFLLAVIAIAVVFGEDAVIAAFGFLLKSALLIGAVGIVIIMITGITQ